MSFSGWDVVWGLMDEYDPTKTNSHGCDLKIDGWNDPILWFFLQFLFDGYKWPFLYECDSMGGGKWTKLDGLKVTKCITRCWAFY